MIYHCEITPDLAASRKSLGKVHKSKAKALRAWFEAEQELLDGVCELLEQRAQQYVAKQKQKMTAEALNSLDKAKTEAMVAKFKSQHPELKVEKGQKAHEVALEAIEALLDDHDSHVATVELEQLD